MLIPLPEYSTFFIAAGLLAPIWLPAVRFVISFFRKQKSKSLAFVWCYFAAFAWSFCWVSYQWAIQIPSGIGYLLALLTAWPVMLAGVAVDPLFRKEKN